MANSFGTRSTLAVDGQTYTIHRLSAVERARVLAVLQSATADGGVHLVETIVAGRATLGLDELRESYAGWSVSVEGGPGSRARTFVARKS